MIIQHGDVRMMENGENFYTRGMKAGIAAAKQSPGWTDGELAQQSANKAIVYFMASEDGVMRFMAGFEKGYRAGRQS